MKNISVRAPLRISFAGGGTDLPSYYNNYGGEVINATINKFIYITIKVVNKNYCDFIIKKKVHTFKSSNYKKYKKEGTFYLLRASFEYLTEKYNDSQPINCETEVISESSPGTGLGSSSTLIVAFIKGLTDFYGYNLSKKQIANEAYIIERKICNLSGGLQDHFAASYGGFNHLQINKKGNVKVKKLKLSRSFLSRLETSIYLLNLGVSRNSSTIINDQNKNIKLVNKDVLNNFSKIKSITKRILASIENESLDSLVKSIDIGWEYKKKTSNLITNKNIDECIKVLRRYKARGIKVSGAGGGGYLFFFADIKFKNKIIKEISRYGEIETCTFINHGVFSWR